MDLLFQSTEETDEIIIQKGIDIWSQDGCSLMPHLDSSLSGRHQPLCLNNRGPVLPAAKIPVVSVIKIDMSAGSIIEEEFWINVLLTHTN